MIRASRRTRKGASVVQMALVVAVITAAVFVGLQMLGTTSRDDMNQTAEQVGDPSSLVGRFGSGSSGGSDSGTTGAGGDSGGESDDWYR